MLKPKLLLMVGIGLAVLQATGGAANAGWWFGSRGAGCGETGNYPRGFWTPRDSNCDSQTCNTCRDCDECNDCDDCDEDCDDCDKKKKKKKKCCLFTCFDCAEPPRGEAAVSVAARINRDAFRESAELTNRRNAAAQESANASDVDKRVDNLERDLTKLTIVVEEVAKNQKQQQEDLTKATLILERLAEKVGAGE